MSELVLRDVDKRFGAAHVLRGLDLTLTAGSLTALLGPSGVGKTTLLRLLAGFEAPDRGTITLGGRLLAGPGVAVAPERRRIGYMPQEGSLFPHLTVAGNVGFGLGRAERRGGTPGRLGWLVGRSGRFRGRSGSGHDGRQVQELIELVGLVGLERRYPHELSGGQQQRVALARALAVRPELVLLDEPFAALDAQLRGGLRADVCQILKDAGTTTLLVTHNQEEALSVADSVAVLRDGRLVQQAPPAALYRAPADDRLARFVGEANLLAGTLRADGTVLTPLGPLPVRWDAGAGGGAVGAGNGMVADGARNGMVTVDAGDRLVAGQPVTVLIRPEQVAVVAVAGVADDGDARGVLHPMGRAARVRHCEFFGHDCLLEVELEPDGGGTVDAAGGGTRQPLLARQLGGDLLAPGDRCTLSASGPVLVWPR